MKYVALLATLAGAAADDRPSAREYHSFTAVGDSMYLFGGQSELGELFNDVHVLHAPTLEWSGALVDESCCVEGRVVDSVDPRPPARARHAAAAVDELIYVFGGVTADGAANDLHAFDTAARSWLGEVPVAGMQPPARLDHHMLLVDRSLLVLGGWGSAAFSADDKPLTDLWALDADSRAWLPVGEAGAGPIAREASAAVVGDAVYVFGGRSEWLGRWHNDALSFTPAATGWTELQAAGGTWAEVAAGGVGADQPSERVQNALVGLDDGRLAVLGGVDRATGAELSDAHVLDTATGEWSGDVSGDSLPAVVRGAYDVVDGRLFYFGGSVQDRPTDTLWVVSMEDWSVSAAY